MAKIPTYDSGGILPTAAGVTPVAGAESGLGKGLEAIGAGMAQLDQAHFNMEMRAKHEYEKLQEEDARLWALNSMADFRRQTIQQFENDKDQAGPGATGFAGQQNQSYEDRIKNFMGKAPNKRSQYLFEAAAREFQGPFFSHAISFEANERQRYRFQTHIDGAKSEADEIAMSADPLTSYSLLVPPRLSAIEQTTMDPSARTKARDVVSAHFSETLVLADARVNPLRALQRLDDGTYAKQPGWLMDGEKMLRLRQSIQHLAERKDGEAIAAVKLKMENWLATVEGLKPAEPNGAVSFPPEPTKEELNLLSPLEREHAAMTISVAKATKQLGVNATTMSPKNFTDAIQALDDANKAGKYTPVEYSNIRANVEKIYNQALTLRKNDSGMAAHMAANDFFKDSYSKASLPEQLRLRQLAAQAIGIPTLMQNLLTNEEAKQQVGIFEKIPTMDQLQQAFVEFKKSLVGNSVGSMSVKVVDSKGVTAPADYVYQTVMGQLFNAGLNKNYNFLEFTQDTKYGNAVAAAIRLKTGDEAKAHLPQTFVHQIRKSLDENSELNAFMTAMQIGMGPNGAEWAGTLRTLLERTAYVVGEATNQNASQLAADIVRSVISDQLHVAGSYWVPKKDPVSGLPIDSNTVSKNLDYFWKNWTLPGGRHFVPDYKTLTPALNGTPQKLRDSLNSTNTLWINNPTGDGLYLATRVKGSAGANLYGQYYPVTDVEGQFFEVKFKDLASPVQRVSGKIRGM